LLELTEEGSTFAPPSVAPRITLSFGANIDHDNIVEGNDVYFECHIEANPAVYKVEWRKNVSISVNLVKK
jgi:hypothetical protein